MSLVVQQDSSTPPPSRETASDLPIAWLMTVALVLSPIFGNLQGYKNKIRKCGVCGAQNGTGPMYFMMKSCTRTCIKFPLISSLSYFFMVEAKSDPNASRLFGERM
jgi:hypothetical protein